MLIPFDNTYARLPDRFFARLPPTPVAAPGLLKLNRGLAEELGLDADWLASADGVAMLAGVAVPEGAEPIATVYAGHQFGGFSPQLGDGRAVLLGEVVDRHGRRRDIQLKGSGPTPYSRMGDGRAAVGPVLREYLVSEAMAALGIPTTRALAAVATGETIHRERRLPGAVLTRVAASHIRVGTFEYHAARGDTDAVKLLADHVITRHYPDLAGAQNPYRALLSGVAERQADLVARWLLVGFVHGVMNTDNTSVSGETIDYGPCAFIDGYDPGAVYSSIDHGGRYAYANQPRIMHWNLARFAETLLPLLDEDQDKAVAAAHEALAIFPTRFEAAWHAGLRGKLGLAEAREGDRELANDLLALMGESRADFTLTFRGLSEAADGGDIERVRELFVNPTALDPWVARWRARLAAEGRDPSSTAAAMRAINPAYIPRNFHVEAALEAAGERGDLAPFEALLAVLSRPFEEQPGCERYKASPEPNTPYRTFCGT
ncbi:hypothetical protein RHAL1_02005 [Beijerinckiaceae bacterium RH AL1]|nr:YdiU family protein [Beijerinckiaceae bacterium]VVB45889.1 hypothetical protein RHCH11_RHCH11_01966 [Beijerinckiaceae bacterium RH CH11]VVB45967.1 hypothetical protein RHAL8_01962 [Beijerinckiaceae bacterium RH AL8]VVC55092.1 hypothetical protein RHAL1_02005 [Beijerinckiaceae bacterium RH AL1]